MHSFKVLLKKEIFELYRVKKMFVFIGIFLFFGMLSPLTARYMKEILEALLGEQLPAGLLATEPTWQQGWMEFYNNLTQFGLFCVIFMFMGAISGERKSGTAALTLTKNISHESFILAKFVAAKLLIIVSTIVGVCMCIVYTSILFEDIGEVINILAGAFVFIIYLILVLSITIFASSLARSTAIGAFFSFVGVIFVGILGQLPKIGEYTPGTLLSRCVYVTLGEKFSEAIIPCAISVGISIILVFFAISILKKREI